MQAKAKKSDFSVGDKVTWKNDIVWTVKAIHDWSVRLDIGLAEEPRGSMSVPFWELKIVEKAQSADAA